MKIRKFWIVLCISLLPLAPAFASLADLQTSVAGVSGSTVTISVHNAGQQMESVKVQVTVQLSDGSTQTMTSSKIVVAAGGTASITVTAGSYVSGITDDPEPMTVS